MAELVQSFTRELQPQEERYCKVVLDLRPSTAVLSERVLDLVVSLYQPVQRVSCVVAWVAIGVCGPS